MVYREDEPKKQQQQLKEKQFEHINTANCLVCLQLILDLSNNRLNLIDQTN